MLFVDPPGGWRYGFPKPMPANVQNVDEWLVQEGYPQELVDSWKGKGVPCRCWYQEEDEDNA